MSKLPTMLKTVISKLKRKDTFEMIKINDKKQRRKKEE